MDCWICGFPARPERWEEPDNVPTCINGHSLIRALPLDTVRRYEERASPPGRVVESVKQEKRERGRKIKEKMAKVAIGGVELARLSGVSESVVYAVCVGVGTPSSFEKVESTLASISEYRRIHYRMTISRKKKDEGLINWIIKLNQIAEDDPGLKWSPIRTVRIAEENRDKAQRLIRAGKEAGYCWDISVYKNGKWSLWEGYGKRK